MTFKMKGFSYPGRSPIKQVHMYTGSLTDRLEKQFKTLTGELPKVVDFSNMSKEDYDRFRAEEKKGAVARGSDSFGALGIYDTDFTKKGTQDERVIRIAPGPYTHDVMRDTRRHEYKHHEQATDEARRTGVSLGKRMRDELTAYQIEQRSKPIKDESGKEWEYGDLPDYAKKQYDDKSAQDWQNLQYITPGTAEYEATQAENQPSPLDKKINTTTTGYKKNSPDVNNNYNIIPSGNITMKGVEFPVRGEDNLGNVKIMQPGKNYKFPGDTVLETPLNSKLDKKISKLYKEGYTAPGQAFAIAKKMGY